MINGNLNREFYLLPELRRSAMWAMGGCVLIACLIVFLQLPQQPKPLIERVVIGSFFMMGAVWLSQYLLPQIKVDEDGISKRVLWWWCLWSWEAFEEGRIYQGIAQYGYKFPDYPWWSQRIELSLLSPEDAKSVDTLIQRVWQPPNAGPVPEKLEIQFKWSKSKKLLLSSDRIVVSTKHQQSEFDWDNVLEVVIWRLERGRQDFRELHLHLKDEEFVFRRRLHQGSETVNWTGATSEELSRYILGHIARENVHDFVLTGISASLAEIEARRERIEIEYRELKKARWIPIPLILLASLLLAIGVPWPKNFLMGMLYCPLAYAVYRIIQERIVKLDHQLDELNNEFDAFARCNQ